MQIKLSLNSASTEADSAILLLGIYLKELETLSQKKHPYVHCSIIYNCQDLEAAYQEMSG